MTSWVARIFASILITGLAAGAANAQGAEPYLLQPLDVVEITVLEDKELNRTALVRPDGKISLPLAGTVQAAGRTPEQVAGTIRARLKADFIEPPSVTVALTNLAPNSVDEEDEIEPREVYVLGEVGRPGRFEYDGEMRINILQALTLAGGPGPFAARTRIQIREVAEGAEFVRYVNYQAIEEGAANDLAELADGAVIVVPERGFLEFE